MPTSETSKYRHLVAEYCRETPGVDIGSSGDPVLPHAIQIDLEQPYCPPLGEGPIHIRGDGSRDMHKWFKRDSLAFVYSSHLLEDFTADEQDLVVMEWMCYVRPGGHLVILMPDKERWQKALANGQPPNLAHKHEGTPGELSRIVAQAAGYLRQTWQVLMDECPNPDDYGIVFVARRL